MKLLGRHCRCTEARWCGLIIQATEWTPRAIRCCKAISIQHRTSCKGILSKICVFDVVKLDFELYKIVPCKTKIAVLTSMVLLFLSGENGQY